MIHLHVHSNFSLLDGTIPIRDLVARVKALGMSSVALTDHNGLYGAIEFYETCQDKGIKPIVGAQISLVEGASVVLLVQNLTGYKNLCGIISKANLRGGHLNFQCHLSDIIERKAGLFVLSGGKSGQISQLVRTRNLGAAEDMCRQFKEHFGEYFFLEMQRFDDWDDLHNARLYQIARRCQVPVVATNDVHLLAPEEQTLRQVLHAIDQNTLRDRVKTANGKELYLKSPRQMHELFRKYPDAIQNTHKIAAKCNLKLTLGKPVFPAVQVPENETPFTYLRKLSLAGARRCYPDLTEEVTKRLNYELGIIQKLGFIPYFLIVKKIVDFCRENSIPCVGRGSAADSLVAYTLGITFADPIRFKLYFERFMNEERRDPPDIDLDICWKQRDRVIEYVYNEFGHDKTAMICTYSTLQSRAAIREVAKTFGLAEDEIKAMTRHVPFLSRLDDNDGKVAKRLEQRFPDNPVFHEIFDLSKRLADFPRHLSIHSGGVIIAPERLTDFTPVEVAGKNLVISQYDMHSIEKLGLVKMDLLGVRSLSIITETLAQAKPKVRKGDRFQEKFDFLNRMKNFSPLDLKGFPEGDPEVLKMVNAGLTMGCFQLESPLMRGTLRKMHVQPLEDFPVAIAIIRPGVAHTGKRDQYIKHRGGLEKVSYLDDSLEDILVDTCGVPVFQEQVMMIARKVAGFTLSQADGLRRVMTKGRSDKPLVESLQHQFMDGALRNGYTQEKAEEIWQYLFKFTGFGFNKAHAATYGILAYQTAFLKRYFPAEFMTAVINNPGAFYSTGVYISECRRLGISILPPDVNRSQILFAKEKGAVRVGLFPVFELTERTQQRIVEEQPFTDIYDFIRRTKAGLKEVEHLIRCGALRYLDQREPVLLFKAKTYFKNGFSKTKAEYLTQNLNLPTYSPQQRIVAELELLGFAVTAHPLALYKDIVPWRQMISTPQLESCNGKRIHFTGWYVTRRTHKTSSGDIMLFLTLEDTRGFCDIVFFPKVFEKYFDTIRGHGPFTITGKLQSRLKGEANLIAEHVHRWQSPGEVVFGRQREAA